MEFSYGQGSFTEGEKNLEGQIILSEHKLYLKDANGDLAQTYIPLEKIERIRRTSLGVEVYVRPSTYYRYRTLFKGEKKHLIDLVRDIAQRRGFKKKFLRNEWVEIDY